MLDEHDISLMKPGQLVSHFLLASYCYYQMDKSPMTDPAYDLLCRRLLQEYDKIEHPHKHLITTDMLISGTAYNIGEHDYPLIVSTGAEKYFANCISGRLREELYVARCN